MPVSDVLNNIRKSGYGEKPSSGAPEEKPESARMIKLSDDEVKELQSYAPGEGQEQQCLVSGRLGPNGEFSVTAVHSPGGDPGAGNENEMAAAVMGKPPMPPMPSPS